MKSVMANINAVVATQKGKDYINDYLKIARNSAPIVDKAEAAGNETDLDWSRLNEDETDILLRLFNKLKPFDNSNQQ